MSKVASSSLTADVMSMDFTKPWDLSDVALKLKDSDNLLHANKMVLAVNSVFFKTLFLSDSFAESKQKIVSVDISYWSMHCVLRILHHTAIHFGGGPSVRIPVPQLIELYRAADYCDVALIRQLCKHEMSKLPFPAALEVYITLGLSKEKTEVLKHMNYTDIEIYLMKGIPGAIFSAEDTAIMLEKCKEIESKKARCLKCGKAQVVGKKQNGDIVSAWCQSCKAHFKIK